MKRSTILAGALAGAALVSVPALAGATQLYGRAECQRAYFGGISFPSYGDSTADFELYVDGRLQATAFARFRSELSPALAIGTTGSDTSPLVGDHRLVGFGSYTLPDGRTGARRQLFDQLVSCSPGPTPAPEPTPGEETPAAPPAIVPAPAPVVTLPGPDRPPAVKLPGPDKPPTVKRRPKPKPKPGHKPRRFTSCTLRGNVIVWDRRPAGVIVHRAADGRWYPVTIRNGKCGPVQGAG